MSTPDIPAIYTSFETFGELLRYLRRRVQLTQRELAIAVGYSEGQISRLEKNQRTPDLTTLLAVFVPALDLEHEPEIVAQLTELAAVARGEADTDQPQSTQVQTRQDGAPSPTAGQPHNTPNNQSHQTVFVSKRVNRYRLPQRLTPFIGREQERAGITQLFTQTRLVTLKGMGGIGKTRLATEVGTSLIAHFHDGVCLVELAAVTEADRLFQVIATALKIVEQPGRTYRDSLESFLTDKDLLLILDNCEHLIVACAQVVEQLLDVASQLHILTTTREALRLPGELIWQVSPLSVPDPANLPAVAQIQRYSAVELFVQQSQSIQPTFRLTTENAQAVATICRRLDGLPLALEMAAAQISGLTVEEIAAALDDRFELLVSGSRTALPRQQTLLAALDWSYTLLSPAEQRLFARLAVFIGGWTATAAQAVCAGDLPLLLKLVQKSLVIAIQSDGQTRYDLLETVREYAHEKLIAFNEQALMREGHLAYFVGLVEETRDLGGRHVDDWVKRIEAEHENLRAAFAWARTRPDDGEMALRLAGGMRPFRHHRGFYTEGIAWLDEALARNGQGPARAKALLAKATLMVAIWGDEQHWVVLAEEALRLFEVADDRLGSAWTLEVLSSGALLTIGEERAAEFTEQALILFQALDCPAGSCRALRNLASVMLARGDQAQAESLCEEALEIAQRIGDTPAAVATIFRLSLINCQRAVELSAIRIAQLRDADEADHLARHLQHYGEFQLILGERASAEAALHECLALWQQLGLTVAMTMGVAPTLQLLGFAAQLSGDLEQATLRYQQASRLYDMADSKRFIYIIRLLLSSMAILQGNFSTAATDLRICLRHFQQQSDSLASILVLGQMAELARCQGFFKDYTTLAGAVDRYEREVRYAFDMGINGVLRLNFIEILAKARAEQHDPRFAAAWNEGETMSLTEIIAYALQQ